MAEIVPPCFPDLAIRLPAHWSRRKDLDFGAVRCLNDGHNNIIGEPIMTKLSMLGIIGGTE